MLLVVIFSNEFVEQATFVAVVVALKDVAVFMVTPMVMVVCISVTWVRNITFVHSLKYKINEIHLLKNLTGC